MVASSSMLILVLLLKLCSGIFAQSPPCYQENLDINGQNLNNGLNDLFGSYIECQFYCSSISGAKYFTWADSTFFEPSYRFTCYCKSTLVDTAPTAGITAGYIDCNDATWAPTAGTTVVAGHTDPPGCYYYDTDLTGTDLVNGLDNKQPSAQACQAVCQGYPEAKYFNWANEDFFDPNYHQACTCKTDKQFTTPTEGVISGPVDCEDSTVPPIGPQCCDTLTFISSGSLASGPQNHLLGEYRKHSEGENGRINYIQPDNSFNPMYLYWYSSLDLWYINDFIGQNMGYALNHDANNAECAEDIAQTWEWWDFENGMWVMDTTAKFVCN